MTKKTETKIMGDFGPELNISAVYTGETSKEVENLVKALQEVSEGKVFPICRDEGSDGNRGRRVYKVGDDVKAYDKYCKIVEIIGTDRFHCKNNNSPFDSFIVLSNEFQ